MLALLYDQQSATPLHYACQRGHADSVAVLLAHGANATAVNSRKQAPADVIGEMAHVRHDVIKAIKLQVWKKFLIFASRHEIVFKFSVF